MFLAVLVVCLETLLGKVLLVAAAVAAAAAAPVLAALALLLLHTRSLTLRLEARREPSEMKRSGPRTSEGWKITSKIKLVIGSEKCPRLNLIR